MNTRKATWLHWLSPIVLLVLLVCVVWLLVDEWRKVRLHRVSDEPGPSVAARSTSNSEAPRNVAETRSEPAGQPSPTKKETWPLGNRQPSQLIAPTPPPGAQQVERTIRLPDGRELTFGGLTWGVEHKYTQAKPPVEPAKTPVAQKSNQPDMRTISIKTTSPSLVVWLHCRSAHGSLLQADFISLVDGTGIEGELSKPSAIFNAAESETVGAWEVANFPRREPSFGIRLYSRDSANKFHRMGQFWAANPAPQKYPVWSSERLPIVKRHGNIEFAFLNMFPDEPLAPHVPLQIRSGDEDASGQWSTCVFRVATPDQPPPQWKLESIALSDATGNVSVPDNMHFTKVGDYLVYSFNRSFWSSETAGKLRAEFTRTWGFSRNELVSFAGLRVPPANRNLQLRMEQKVGDVSLHLEQLTHHKPPILMDHAYWDMELIAALVPEIPGVHVSIVELTDQTGRSIGPGISHALEKHGRSFLFHTAPGSATLNITFAVQRSHVVEFLPGLGRNNALQANGKTGIPLPQFQQARVGTP